MESENKGHKRQPKSCRLVSSRPTTEKSVQNGPCHVPRMDWSTDNRRPCREFSTPLSKTEAVYFTGKKIPEAEQTAHILLVRVGKEGLGRFSSWALPEEQQTPATILGRFKEHLEPQCRKFQDCWTKADGGIPTGSGL